MLLSISERIVRAKIPSDTVELALELLRMRLICVNEDGACGGQIVEVEAYPPNDPSSHCFRGKTPRCVSMFLRPWHAYVYRIYGRYLCLNISSEDPEVGAAVLIRAIVPEFGVPLMEARRKTTVIRDLTRGPSRLTQALQIDMNLDGRDCDDSERIYFTAGTTPSTIVSGPRIGLTKAIEAPLRFFDPTSPYVSGSKRWNANHHILVSP